MYVHLGRNLRLIARIIAKNHGMGTQCGTPVSGSDHLVRALLGCKTKEIVPICWFIISDFQIFSLARTLEILDLRKSKGIKHNLVCFPTPPADMS